MLMIILMMMNILPMKYFNLATLSFSSVFNYNTTTNQSILSKYSTIGLNTSSGNIVTLFRSLNDFKFSVGAFSIPDPFWTIVSMSIWIVLLLALYRFGFFQSLLVSTFTFFLLNLLFFSIAFVSFSLLLLSISILMLSFLLNYLSEKIII